MKGLTMDEKTLIENISYLVTKYLSERNDLMDLIQQDSGSVKYILSEISKYRNMELEEKDSSLIKDISFYYL